MRWGWLLPDASYEVLYEGWERQSYEPRHGRPPFVIRGVYSAAMAMVRARARYLGAVDEEAVVGARAQVTMGGRAGARAVKGSAPGLRAAAGLGASGLSTSGLSASSARASGARASNARASSVRASRLGTAGVGTAPGRKRTAD